MASDRLNTRLPQAFTKCEANTSGRLIRNAYRAIIEGFEDIAEGRYVESSGNWEQDKLKMSQKERDGWC